MGEPAVEVGNTLVDGAVGLLEARHGGRDELRLRHEAVQEQAEHAIEDGARVGLWVAAPDLPVGQDLAAPKHRDREVAVDACLCIEPGVADRLEPLAPGASPPRPAPGASRRTGRRACRRTRSARAGSPSSAKARIPRARNASIRSASAMAASISCRAQGTSVRRIRAWATRAASPQWAVAARTSASETMSCPK